jgi:peptidyl-prolyl cis-trans isomerase C
VIAFLVGLGCQKVPAQSAGNSGNSAVQPAGQATSPTTRQSGPAGAASGSQTKPVPSHEAAPGQEAAPAVKPVPEALPDVLARVNGEPISRDEFHRALRNVEAGAGRQVPADQRDKVYRGILNQLVTLHLLLQEARARNVSVAEGDINARVDRVKKQFPNEQDFTKALASRNMTVEALREEARTELLVARMVEAEVKPKIQIQETDVKEFYDKNPQQFQQPETYRASHILIRVEANATEAQKKEARAKAEALLKQIQGGADFATVARENSQDGSASNGGDLNFFRKGQMVPAFEQAVQALKVGEVSGVVETQFGYHVIKLTDRRPARTVPLAEVSTKIGQFLMARAQQQKAGEFVETLKAKSKIQILI